MHLRLSVFLLAAFLTGQVHAQVPASSGPYAEAEAYLREQGIAQGYAGGSFGSELRINRAETAKILVLAMKMPMSGSSCFNDVKDDWYAIYVCTAWQEGLLSGYPDGSFRPDQSLTLAEAASLVVRAHEGHELQGEPWYVPYYVQLLEWDAVPPTAGAMHEPITRGEMAYIIWKADLAEHGTLSSGSSQSSSRPVYGPSYDPYDDDEDDEDEEEEGEDLRLSIQASSSQPRPGDRVTFTVTIHNEGNESVSIEASAKLGADLVLEDAQNADHEDDEEAEWDDVSISGGGIATLVLIAKVDDDADAGDRLKLRVRAGSDEEEEISVTVQAPAAQTQQPLEDPVLLWNDITLRAVAEDYTGTFGPTEQPGPGKTARAIAIVHAAIYDAVNSIDRTHQPYIAFVSIGNGVQVSKDAAVANAARDTLVALYPAQQRVIDAALEYHLARIVDGPAETVGTLVGRTAASQVLQARSSDGWNVVEMHVPSDQPGRHRVDPLNPMQPYLGAKWGQVRPFVIQTGSQFRAPPPPPIGSAAYAQAYNEVKQFGALHSTVRTQDQTDLGLFWAYDGPKYIGTPPRLYNQITQIIAKQKENTVSQNARLFALINLAQADAGIGSWESKYYYDYWRPVLAIREADAGTGPTGLGDGNAGTVGDTSWIPLGAPASNRSGNDFTPPFPAYPSGHATFGAATFRTIEKFYGTDAITFTFTSDELNGVTTDSKGVVRPLKPRTYTSLSAATRDNAQSRIYLGIHWSFDATAGIDMGTKIADYTYANALKPLGN